MRAATVAFRSQLLILNCMILTRSSTNVTCSLVSKKSRIVFVREKRQIKCSCFCSLICFSGSDSPVFYWSIETKALSPDSCSGCTIALRLVCVCDGRKRERWRLGRRAARRMERRSEWRMTGDRGRRDSAPALVDGGDLAD